MGLWTKKSMSLLMQEAEGEAGQPTLRRALSATNLVLLGIGAIIGAGIFVITGAAAAQYAGPGIVWSFVIAGVGCVFAGLCYAEFASMIPIAGSAYTYGYATLGEFFAWIIGWDLILEYLFAASTVSVGWSGYFVAFMRETLGVTLPAALVNAPFTTLPGTNAIVRTGAIINLPAIALIAVLTTLLVIGIRESARANNVIVFLKLAVVALVIIFGFQYVNTANWTPFVPPNEGEFGKFGWTGVFRASGVVFFAYIGFDAVSTAAQEAKNPKRDMPIGILGSLAICTILYILMALVMTGLANYRELNVPHPVFVAISKAPSLSWLSPIVNIGAIAGLASVVLVMLLGQPRIFYSMSRDGLLPAPFSKIHPKFRTPYITTIITGVVAAVIAGLFPIGILGELVSIGTLLAFVMVSAGIIVLRYTRPELPRPFRTPFVPVVPALAILICGFMMYWLPRDTWIRLGVWMAIGLVIYFLYGRSHSGLARAERGG